MTLVELQQVARDVLRRPMTGHAVMMAVREFIPVGVKGARLQDVAPENYEKLAERLRAL